MCQDIEQRLAGLRQERRNLNAVIGNLQGAGLQAAQANLARLDAEIDEEEDNLADCQAVAAEEDDPTPQAFLGRVKKIHCSRAGAEIGRQEPYLLIGSVDMLAQLTGPLPTSKPSVHCTKVGPWTRIQVNTTPSANVLDPRDREPFWDLNRQPRIVASPQDVVFVVALVENDGASPDAIRGAVHSALEVSILQNLNRDYETFSDTLADAMTGAIAAARGLGISPGHANFDDPIDRALRLTLTDGDLHTINALGVLEKTLTFRRELNSGKVTDEYTVTFVFET